MNWSDYEMVWKRQKPPVGAAADVKDLRDTFETKRRKLYAALMVRDYTESAAGIVVVIAFGFIWWKQGRTGWPIALAILLTMSVVAVFVRERIRVRRNRQSPNATLLAKVESDLAELQHQRRLLRNVGKWYFMPLLAAMIIVVVTITRSRPPWDIAHDPIFITAQWGFNGLIIGAAWMMNHRAVRKRIEPRIAELEKLRRDLVSEF